MVLLLVENVLQLRNERSIFGGRGELKQEAERIFELVFNFSVLTTARLLEGYIDNELMF